MHDGMPYGRIQGQGHEPLKVWIPSIFKTYLLRMDGATVLKVGDNFASGASQKIFLIPHFLASGGGDKILLR